jgi:hypothetical protein
MSFYCQSDVALLIGTISYENQDSCANFGNFNTDHRIPIRRHRTNLGNFYTLTPASPPTFAGRSCNSTPPFRSVSRSAPFRQPRPPLRSHSGPRAGGVALLLPKTPPPRVSSAGSWQSAAALASPGVPPPSTASPPFRALGPTRPPPPPGTDPSVRRRLPLVAKVAAARSPAQRAPPQPDEASCTSSSYRYGSSSASRG